MLLIILLAVVAIAAIELYDEQHPLGADLVQRRALESLVIMAAMSVIIATLWW